MTVENIDFNKDLIIEKPKNKIEELLPSRQKLAIDIANIIKNYKYNEGIVLGLYGSWGNGKTSVINAISEALSDCIGKECWIKKLKNVYNKSITKKVINIIIFLVFYINLLNLIPPVNVLIKSLNYPFIVNYLANPIKTIFKNLGLSLDYNLIIFLFEGIFVALFLLILFKIIVILFSKLMNKLDKKEKGNKILTIKFNPWNLKDQDQIITEFFELLSKEIINNHFSDEIQIVGKLLEQYGNLIKDNKSKEIGKLIQTINYNKDINTLKTEIIENLNMLKDKKILIIIDDIDRLNLKEIDLVFQLVKCVADFPNVIYLLSFDNLVVEKMFTAKGDLEGSEYIKKIIQLPFNLTKITDFEIKHEFFRTLIECSNIYTFQIENETIEYLCDLYRAYLKYYFSNFRDINIFRNSLMISIGKMNTDICFYEYVILLILQIFDNDIYRFLATNKDLLLDSRNYVKSNVRRLQTIYSSSYQKMLNNSKVLSSEELRQLILHIFPKTKAYFEHENDQTTTNQIIGLRRNYNIETTYQFFKSVSDPFYFDHYFVMSEEEDIDLDFVRIFDVLMSGNKSYDEILTIINNRLSDQVLLERFITYLLKYHNNYFLNISQNNLKNLLLPILDKSEDYIALNKIHEWFDQSCLLYLRKLINKIYPEENFFQTITYLIKNTKNALLIMILLIENYKEYNRSSKPDEQIALSINNLLLSKFNDNYNYFLNFGEIIRYLYKISDFKQQIKDKTIHLMTDLEGNDFVAFIISFYNIVFDEESIDLMTIFDDCSNLLVILNNKRSLSQTISNGRLESHYISTLNKIIEYINSLNQTNEI